MSDPLAGAYRPGFYWVQFRDVQRRQWTVAQLDPQYQDDPRPWVSLGFEGGVSSLEIAVVGPRILPPLPSPDGDRVVVGDARALRLPLPLRPGVLVEVDDPRAVPPPRYEVATLDYFASLISDESARRPVVAIKSEDCPLWELLEEP